MYINSNLSVSLHILSDTLHPFICIGSKYLACKTTLETNSIYSTRFVLLHKVEHQVGLIRHVANHRFVFVVIVEKKSIWCMILSNDKCLAREILYTSPDRIRVNDIISYIFILALQGISDSDDPDV